MLSNKEISKHIKLLAELMDLHNENSFKVKAYQNASFQIGKYASPIAELAEADIEKIPGVGKNMAPKITELIHTESIATLDDLITATPHGVLNMLSIKGLGASKVKALWQEHHIEDVDQLLEHCISHKIRTFKGFAEKTEQSIREAIEFKKQNERNILFSQAELFVAEIEKKFKEKNISYHVTGGMYRKDEIIEHIDFVVLQSPETQDLIAEIQETYKNIDFEFHLYTEEKNAPSTLFKTSAQDQFLSRFPNIRSDASESEIFEENNLPYMIPEMRNGLHEWDWIKTYKTEDIIDYKDLKGALHNHSRWSDGMHTIEEMAGECMRLGFSYFGIADHSKSATYARGLNENQIQKQHEEVDVLNQKYPQFKILKGIEADILSDGSLDYSHDILSSFDYVVASVHSVLNMNKDRATQRLLKAIENPYTSILGHPSGRLLLQRKGYELDYDMIFDACKQNQVIIEINANPWRLDLDWRLIYSAMEKGCLFSINPDAHKKETLTDMRYGVNVARKAGLNKERVINTFEHDKLRGVFKK